MKCPKCKSPGARVYGTKHTAKGETFRYRQCRVCQKKFTTLESVAVRTTEIRYRAGA